ncbi:MAG TPA: precorrin-8X methylmutase [Nitrososphaeraceae archaeon]|nr:precorrin-8X methylmutase [Nitrososphaeraceae archaeon]
MTSYNKNYETPANREMSNRAFDIEKKSLDIIDSEIGQHDYNELEWAVVRRVIHATADFDFARRERIIFHRNAIESASKAIRNKCNIVTDVDMVLSAINKKLVTDLGLKVMCYISDKSLANEARKFNKTRSEMAMRRAANEMNGGIVAIGNAPTALYETINMIREDVAKPALVIGIPVGFVSATESKDELMKINIPFITNVGRKGGSPAASSILNAILLLCQSST